MVPWLGALQSLDNKASFEERLSRLDTDLIRIWNFEDNEGVSVLFALAD